MDGSSVDLFNEHVCLFHCIVAPASPSSIVLWYKKIIFLIRSMLHTHNHSMPHQQEMDCTLVQQNYFQLRFNFHRLVSGGD
jgi:hypothetical protein